MRLSALAFFVCMMHMNDAWAQSSRFAPAERGSDWFAMESLDLRGNPEPAVGVVGDWGYDRGATREDQVFLHVGGALVFRDRFRVAADLPLGLYEDAGAGDLRLGADVRLLGEYGRPFGLAAGCQVFLPTSRALTGERTVRPAPHLLVAGRIEGFIYAAKLAYLHRETGPELNFGAAVGLKANDRFVFGPELSGSTVVGTGAHVTPLEILIGGHVKIREDFQAGLGIGPGITRGEGAPTMRVVGSFEYAPDVCVDKDGDGICAFEDACPDVDGVRTDDRHTNGCPPDRDHDGFRDDQDACPDERGFRTIDPTTNGCPDHDRDGIADGEDDCPYAAGDANNHGCPNGVAPVIFREKIRFAAGSSQLDDDAFASLLHAVETLKAQPDLRIRIEGHADDRENAKEVALARAESVRQFLVFHGIDDERLRMEGYGSDRMTDTSGTDHGRQRNRRVELHVIEAAP